MAVIPAANVAILYNPTDVGVGERDLVLRIRNVTTGDTFDVAAYLSKVTSGSFIPSGVLATIGVVTPTGTNLAFTLTSLANDTIYVVVKGESAP